MTDIDRILKFWFVDGSKQDKLWFGKDAQVDQTIRTEFGPLFDDAKVEEWPAQPGGRLAAILLYDQFTRNAFRDTPRMFAYDAKALVLARGVDPAQHSVFEAVFQLLPFEHSENLADQDHCVAALREVERRAPLELRDSARGYVDFALRHRAIIERFGRFPHRNQILGRPSTVEEMEFLKQPGSGF